jgi:hypothetical protein
MPYGSRNIAAFQPYLPIDYVIKELGQIRMKRNCCIQTYRVVTSKCTISFVTRCRLNISRRGKTCHIFYFGGLVCHSSFHLRIFFRSIKMLKVFCCLPQNETDKLLLVLFEKFTIGRNVNKRTVQGHTQYEFDMFVF